MEHDVTELNDLKLKIHQYLIAKTNFLKVKDQMNDDQLRVFVDKAITDMCIEDQLEISTELRIALIRDLVSAVVSLGPIRSLMEDASITEVMINGANQVYVQRRGHLEKTDIKFMHNQHLAHTIQKILASSDSSTRIDESNPYADFSMADGSRVNVVLPPCSLQGPIMTIRKFSEEISEVEDLIKLEEFNVEMGELLKASMKAKLNIVFCGATGTGKTTALNCFSRHIPEEERIITIEDTPELRLKQEHVVTLQSKPANIEGKGAISIRDLFINSLRMRPDRLIVGEVRSQEMLDLIQSISSGHTGSLAIVHADSPEDAFARMVTMMLMTGIKLSTEEIRRQVAKAIDLIVHIELFVDGVRRMTNITDITYDKSSDEVSLHDIFLYKQKEVTAEGKIIGDWVFDHKKPSFYQKFITRHVALPKHFFPGD